MELRDCRTKLTVLSDQVVEAVARNTGRDKSEIVRVWIHERALQELAHAEMITRLVRGCEGTASSAATHQSPEGE